jgi:hypothetical protein
MFRNKSRRSSLSSAVIGAALGLSAATAMQAQQRVFEWQGRVEHDADILIAGGSFTVTRADSNLKAPRGESRLTRLPQRDGEIAVNVEEGRGKVQVVQQPQSANGFTAVIRICDPENGAGLYRLNAIWQATAAGEVSPFMKEPITARVTPTRVALMWSGDVDSDLKIVIRPQGITYETVRGLPPNAIQSAISEMPSADSYLEINMIVGRGEATIEQQPTPENAFTAIVRVRDPQPGFGHYAFMAMWR